MTEPSASEVEEAIKTCVREFYAKARQDTLLGPIFNSTVKDWDDHLRVIADFWSKVLLQTNRYNSSPFPLHRPLPVEPEHFTRWLELFEETTSATLPPPHAAKAQAKARHMAESFKAGIFPFFDKEGRPSRHPG
ncbi:MAG TPA: group III truncated hemoglobin [Methylocella sp.]|nr:group III truncated hemoglobin [Methylocella sp.]